MHTARPKIALDHELLKWINDFYGYKLKPENHLDRHECFSAPDFDLHGCCIIAKLPGGKDCKCGHVPGRMCDIVCKIHEFCAAVYAYRLGIGGDEKYKALSENLKLKYRDIYNKIQEVVGAMESEIEEGAESTRIMTVKELDGKLPSQSELDKMEETEGEREMQVDPKEKKAQEEKLVPLVEGVVEEVVEEVPESELEPEPVQAAPVLEEDKLLTVKEAAEMYGCTYANIAAKINSGILDVEVVKGKKRVRTSALLRAKTTRSKRGRPSKK